MASEDTSQGEFQYSLANEALRRQYLKAGMAGRVGWGNRPALLVIDMAAAWADPEDPIGTHLQDVTDGITRLLSVARKRDDIPIFFTTIGYDADYRELGHINRLKLPALERLVRGGDGPRVLPEMERQSHEPLIEKQRGSAFFGTPLVSLLISAKVDTTIIVGVSTSGCVRETALDAYNNNFHVILPAEALGDRSRLSHEASLFDMDARMGDVMPLEGVIEHLRD